MGIDGTAIAAAGKRALALGLLFGALTVLALLLGTGSAQAKEKGLGHALGLKTGQHHASTTHHAHKKATTGRTHAAPKARHAVRHTVRSLVGSQPVRRNLAPVTQPTTPRSQPTDGAAASPVRDTVKATVGTVRSTKPVKRLRDTTLLLQKTVGDVRRTAQQLSAQVLPALPPLDVPGLSVPPMSGPDNGPAAASPQAANAFGSADVSSHSGDVAGVAAGTTTGVTSTQGTAASASSPGLLDVIGTAVSALRDIPATPSPDLPRPGDDLGMSSSVALFVGLLATAFLLSLMSGLVRLRSRRFRLVPHPNFLPGSSPD